MATGRKSHLSSSGADRVEENCCFGISLLGLLERSTTNWVVLSHRNIPSPSHGGQKSTIQVWEELVPPDGHEGRCVPRLSPGIGEAVSALSLHIIFTPCMSVSPSVPCYKCACHITLGLHQRPYFNWITSVKTLSPNKVTFWGAEH